MSSPSKKTSWPILALLAIHASLLMYLGARNSPTELEPGFLASGLYHWETGNFRPYRVNPPLQRLIAALPVKVLSDRKDWMTDVDLRKSRIEYDLGRRFLDSYGSDSVILFAIARWTCIPITLIGVYFAYRWAADLYGWGGGILTAVLYIAEPTLSGHGCLITPDSACVAFGIAANYFFRQWLKVRSPASVLWTGIFLGLCLSAKLSSLLLVCAWPGIWFAWRFFLPARPQTDGTHPSLTQDFLDFIVIVTVAILLINLIYLGEGSGTALNTYRFKSAALTGSTDANMSGNRFRDSPIGYLPIPLPGEFLLGADEQQADLERYSIQSFLNGQWSNHGWWYYYIVGIAVKMPLGHLGLFALIVLLRVYRKNPRENNWYDELLLIVPMVILFSVVSSHTTFSIHFRYVLPALGFMVIILGQAWRYFARSGRLIRSAILASLVFSISSSACSCPHHISYFNESVGGPLCGYKYLRGSSYDWGQDLYFLLEDIARLPPCSDCNLDIPGDVADAILSQDRGPSSIDSMHAVERIASRRKVIIEDSREGVVLNRATYCYNLISIHPSLNAQPPNSRLIGPHSSGYPAR